MLLRPFLFEATSCASYLFGCPTHGKLAAVDPHVELVETYIEAAERAGSPIVAVFETHVQADHVSGLPELVERTGATAYLPADAGVEFEHVALRDGDVIELGNTRVTALATPGHAPAHLAFVIADVRRGTLEPWLVFTGDSLLVGDVGRPDLHARGEPEPLARELYASLQKLLALPDEVLVYPSHYGGSVRRPAPAAGRPGGDRRGEPARPNRPGGVNVYRECSAGRCAGADGLLDPEGAHLAALRGLGDFAGARVCEVGCGDGRLTTGIARDAATVFAFDPDEDRLAEARRRLPNDLRDVVTYEVGSARDIELPKGEFDLVVFSWSLCCMERDDVVHALRRFRRALAPSGAILDLQVVPPEPAVEADGGTVCRLEGGTLLAGRGSCDGSHRRRDRARPAPRGGSGRPRRPPPLPHGRGARRALPHEASLGSREFRPSARSERSPPHRPRSLSVAEAARSLVTAACAQRHPRSGGGSIARADGALMRAQWARPVAITGGRCPMRDPAIRVQGLSKQFGSVVALTGIDLEVPVGTVFGLLGPNGAGKTTTLRVLATILRPDRGRAEVLGLDVVRNAAAVRSRIGLAGQHAAVDGSALPRRGRRVAFRSRAVAHAELPDAHLRRAATRDGEAARRAGAATQARAAVTYNMIVEGVLAEEDEFVAYATSQFQKRYDRIARACERPLRELEEELAAEA